MNLIKMVLVVLALVFSASASASGGTQTSVTVKALQEGSASATTPFFVQFTSANSTPASCATSTSQFAVDPTTQAGQALINLISMIYALGKTATFTGLGTCAISSGTEDLASVVTTD
jgi:hypothetical protein